MLGQEPLIALKGLRSLMFLFNQRRAGNIWPIPASALPSALSFFSAVQPRHIIVLAKGGKPQSIVVSKRVATSGGRVFCWGARNADSAEKSELADFSIQSTQSEQHFADSCTGPLHQRYHFSQRPQRFKIAASSHRQREASRNQ